MKTACGSCEQEQAYLEETLLLDYQHPLIKGLIMKKGWNELATEAEKIKQIYDFVKDEILFGFNASDDVPASQVLRDGYGQCNTKSTLCMALFRAVGIACRFHGFLIDKKVQNGAFPEIVHRLTPSDLFHSWVEVCYDGKWIALEGLILDKKYLQTVQSRFEDCVGSFCGYGVATKSLHSPDVEWQGGNTYIQ